MAASSSRSVDAVSGAGWVLWALMGMPAIIGLWRGVSRMPAPWLLAWVVFGALLACERAMGDPRRRLLLLGGRVAAALTLVWFGRGQIEGTLLVLTAAEVGRTAPVRASVPWAVVQWAALVVVLSLRPGKAPPMMALVTHGAVEGLGLVLGILVRRERRARGDLERAHAELVLLEATNERNARLGERLRIARDLHDSVGHHLTALALHLDLARRLGSEPAQAPLVQAHELAKETLEEVRRVVGTLREPRAADPFDELRRLASRIPSPAVSIAVAPEVPVLPPEVAEAALRCTQEIITNAVRHAGARVLRIEVGRSDGRIEIRATDDGRGAPRLEPGHGLAGLRERVEALGGDLEIRSRPGAGFQVVASLPLARPGGAS